MGTCSLILHGGCGTYNLDLDIERESHDAKLVAMERIISEGWSLLSEGLSAVSVVEKVVNLMEDAPCFNAGIGASLGTEKQVELDASIMDGRTRNCGAVACLKGIPHAVSVARSVMDNCAHRFLVGEGANEFARSQGYSVIPDEDFVTDYQLHWWEKAKARAAEKQLHSTVGAVALDSEGNIASATSTGGLTWKMPGRVGDTPIIGAGTYADNRFGGASATGIGEQIIRTMLTRTAIDALAYQQCDAHTAAIHSIKELAQFEGGSGGVILISKDGQIGASSNETHMPHAFMSSEMNAPMVTMKCREGAMLSSQKSEYKLT